MLLFWILRIFVRISFKILAVSTRFFWYSEFLVVYIHLRMSNLNVNNDVLGSYHSWTTSSLPPRKVLNRIRKISFLSGLRSLRISKMSGIESNSEFSKKSAYSFITVAILTQQWFHSFLFSYLVWIKLKKSSKKRRNRCQRAM